MSITIDLSTQSLTACKQFLNDKEIEVRQLGKQDRFLTKVTATADIQGATAEAAWAQLMDVPYVYKPYDPANDDVAGIQIRSTKHKNGNLMIYKKDPVGVYVLGIVNDNCTSVNFVGWSTYDRVVQPANYKTQLGTYTLAVPAYCVNQLQLKSFLDWPPRLEVAHGAF
jgi:hypothetical protein